MIAKDFIPYIGCRCLIFDSTGPDIGVPATIEGVDIVNDTVIADRVHFGPEEIKLILRSAFERTGGEGVAPNVQAIFVGSLALCQEGYDMTGLLDRGEAIPEEDAPSKVRQIA